MSSAVLLICKLRLVLYSAGSRMKSIHVLILRSLDLIQTSILDRYHSICAFAVGILLCVAVIVMSSAYITDCMRLEKYRCVLCVSKCRHI